MIHRIFATTVVACGLFCLSSCRETVDTVVVLSANARYDGGDYSAAVSGYLSVGTGKYDGVVDYNAAVGFAAIGEMQVAADVFERLKKSDNREIASSALYDLGTIAFQKGEFEKAVNLFRESLREFPGRPDAAVALEAAVAGVEREAKAKQAAKSSARTSTISGADLSRGSGDSRLDLIGRFESPVFRPGEGRGKSAAGDDL